MENSIGLNRSIGLNSNIILIQEAILTMQVLEYFFHELGKKTGKILMMNLSEIVKRDILVR